MIITKYDDKTNPGDFISHIPFIVGITFQKNNLLKKEIKLANGTTQTSENFVHQYLENGLPKYRTKTIISQGNMATLTNAFLYQSK